MTTKLTLFTATLVQESALSVSGLDRESSSDQPFALVDGVPTLVGRGLKGAAVAMARRFFDPLPRAVSDSINNGSLRRSAWEFANATTTGTPRLRAGVGIRHKTGARAGGVLYDREVMPAGTKWSLDLRVDCSYARDEDEGHEAEGILGYVLARHWAEGRCWLGGGAARGLGWCRLEGLRAWRLDEADYDRWVESGRTLPLAELAEIPTVSPTHSWCFRTLDVAFCFGEYRPDPDEPAWGLDMLAVGTHDSERTHQATGNGAWARPAWVAEDAALPDGFDTDRAILMEGGRPLLPGSSVRGPLRHAFSRAERAAGRRVQDPHTARDPVPEEDTGGQAFGTVTTSSRILVRDGRARGPWAAAKLHMHAEDEFSAGSYGSAKRDAVRVLRGEFPVRIVIEGAEPSEVDRLMGLIDRQVALGALGHLPVGGHKTRGAGWGRWTHKGWRVDDVLAARRWTPPRESEPQKNARQTADFINSRDSTEAWVRASHGPLEGLALTLAETARSARLALGARELIAWWCDPTIDLTVTEAPATFGRDWPLDEALQVDEVAFFTEGAVWRASRTGERAHYVLVEEVETDDRDAQHADVVHTPARLHAFERFSSANTGTGSVLLREWHVRGAILGFTIAREER